MTGPSWKPANEAEGFMFDALVRNDSQAFFRTFATSTLYLPAFMSDAGTERQRIITKTINGELYLMVFTSVPGLTGFVETGYTPDSRPDCYVTTTYDELSAKRPDPEWRLAINAGLPIDAYVSIDSVRDAVLGVERIPLAEEVIDPEAGAGGAVAPIPADFRPANDTETAIEFAMAERDVDMLTDVLVVSDVLVPTGSPVSGPEAIAAPDFPWRPTDLAGKPTIPVFTSPERLVEAVPSPTASVWVKFVAVAAHWPDPGFQLAVNPNSSIEFLFPGEGVPGFVDWAAELADRGRPHVEAGGGGWSSGPVLLQAVVPADQVDRYLPQNHHRVAGYVHEHAGVAELNTPELLHAALLTDHAPFSPADETVHVLRWYGYCPALYRGISAPGDSRVREYRVNSAELPHGAQLYRLDRYGRAVALASYDADFEAWVPAAPGGPALRGALT